MLGHFICRHLEMSETYSFGFFPPSYADGWLISLHAENWFLQILTFNHLVEFFIFALIYNFSFFFHWTIFSDSHHSSPKFLADIFNIFSLVFLLYFSIFVISLTQKINKYVKLSKPNSKITFRFSEIYLL